MQPCLEREGLLRKELRKIGEELLFKKKGNGLTKKQSVFAKA